MPTIYVQRGIYETRPKTRSERRGGTFRFELVVAVVAELVADAAEAVAEADAEDDIGW